MSLKNNWKPTDTLRNTDVNDIANEINKNTEHKETKITNTDGVHGIKYDESSQELKYKDDSQGWQTIPTGQQAEEDLRLHKEKKVNSVEGVHGFRYNSTNETLEIESEEGQWTEVGGGLAGALLSPVTNIKVKTGNTKLTVSWVDSIEGTWAGTKLVYKVGSYPTNPKDGTLAVDNKVKDQYKDTGFDINALNNGTKYYFMFFPYDSKNKYNLNIDNRAIGTPQAFKTMSTIINQNNSNPETCCSHAEDAISMTPGSERWDEFFGHFPVLFKNGEIVGKLNKTDRRYFADGRKADITSGNEGDVMIAYPCNKTKLYVDSSKQLYASMTNDLNKGNGFESLAHTKNLDPKDYLFIGAYQGFVMNGKLRSLAGKMPTCGIRLDQAREYARANGSGYEQLSFYALTYLQIMYLLKYKNTNSQATIGKGVVNTNYIIETGGTEQKGMDWGESTGLQHVLFAGLEDLWGNAWTWIDGILIDSSGNLLTANNNFNNNGTGYTNNGGAIGDMGFMSKAFGTNTTGFYPTECGGSETTYYTDYIHTFGNISPEFIAFGGMGDNSAGIFNIMSRSINDADGHIGARLMYL